jgi:hypothetical protein
LLVVEAKSQRWRQAAGLTGLPANHSKPTELLSTRWQKAVAVALAALTLLGLILLLGRWGYDDPYITFRYARNLLAGNGFVYNVGERTLSTTAPMYAVLLAGLGWIWSDLSTLSNVISAVALVLSAVILFRWAGDHKETATGMVAALLLSLSPRLVMSFGAETCVYLMLILAGFWTYDRSRMGLAASMLAVAAMIRPDGLLAAAILISYHWIRRRSTPWRTVALYVALVGTWYAGLWLYFGSPLPVTLLTKQRQGQMAISTRFGAGLVEMIRDSSRQLVYWLHGILAVIGLGRVATKARHWIPLLVWTGTYVLVYILLGVSRYFWYYAPLIPALAVLVAEGTMTLIRTLARLKIPRILIPISTGVLLSALLAPLVTGVLGLSWARTPKLDIYREIGQWLEAHTPAQATVGALEVGIIGYFGQRTMIDFAGLIQPDTARQLGSTTSYQDSAAWATQTYEPDYVVLPQDGFRDMVNSTWFQAAYIPLRDFSNQEDQWLTLYQRSASQ